MSQKYVSSEEEQEDLISIGTIGLMKAVDSFRPDTEINLQRMPSGVWTMNC